jgi:hypothetical protein
MVEFLELGLLIAATVLGSMQQWTVSYLVKTIKMAPRGVPVSLYMLAPILGCAVVAGVLHEPVPRVHDEFSYLLMSDTLASGHVSNPTPPLPEFFDTFHVLVHPVYASKYFPGQGLFLAIGQRLTGHPAAGLWLSSALACAAVYWMLQAWVGPLWALVGGFLMVVQYGIFSYWSQTYWGGMVAAMGGALFFGAARRLCDNFSWKSAVWFAIGVIVLMNSRPLEGLLAMLPMTGILLFHVWHDRKWKVPKFWYSVVLPAGVVLLIGAAVSCLYNHAITGSYFKSAYVLHEQQYQESPFLSFLPLRPKLTYSSPWVQYYYEVREKMLYELPRNPKILVSVIARRFATWWSFYCGILLTPALLVPVLLRRGRIRLLQIGVLVSLIFLFAISRPTSTGPRAIIDVLAVGQIVLLWIVFDGLWQRVAIFTCSVLMLEALLVKLFFAHYFAPAASLVLFLQVEGLRRMWHWRRGSELAAAATTRSDRRRAARAQRPVVAYPLRGFVLLLPVACVLSLVVRVEARINGWTEDPHGPDRKALLTHDWSLSRADIQRWLEQQSTRQLVFVRYSARHNVIFEWVYNRADLVHSHVIWARDLGAEHNRLLLQELPDRTVWLLEADRREPQLVPYSEVDSQAPQPVSPKTDTTVEQDQLDW